MTRNISPGYGPMESNALDPLTRPKSKFLLLTDSATEPELDGLRQEACALDTH